MEPTTEQVLRALGTEEAYALVRVLLDRSETFTQLRRSAGLSAQTTRATLEALQMLGIAQKGNGAQAGWHLERWSQTLTVIESARALADALNESRSAAQQADVAALEELRQRGAARPPRPRGRPTKQDD